MTHDARICFVGDSFVQGTQDEEALGWVGRLCASARQAGHDVTGYNLGVRRDTSADIARRWLPECAARLPAGVAAHVVLSFGTNDMTIETGGLRVPPGESVGHLRSMLREAAQRGWRAAFIGPPPIADREQNQRIEALSRQLVEAAREAGVPALSVFAALSDDATWCREVADHDGAHPGAAGYRGLARLVLDWEGWWFR